MTKHTKARTDGRTLKSISVRTLQDKLNSLYLRARGRHHSQAQSRHLDYLWDLKEMALIAGKSSVEVPEEWLLELEQYGTGAQFNA
jgi:hypothetical protein